MLELLEKPETRKMLLRISKEQYHKLSENQKTELLKGVIFQKMSKSPLHANFLQLLLKLMRPMVPEQYDLVSENPLNFVDSEPEPDLAIIEPIHSMRDPHPAGAYLVVEISVTTQVYDAAKAEVYAEANVPLYWQVLPLEKTTVVYSRPSGGKYASIERIPFDAELTIVLPKANFSLRMEDIQ